MNNFMKGVLEIAAFTKNAIIDSFYKLLSHKKLNQITVKDIVTDCGVNRNSFYYYFDDIPSLFAEEIAKFKNEMISSYSQFDSMEAWLLHYVEKASSNKRIISNCAGYIDSAEYQKTLINICEYIINRHMEKMTENLSVPRDDYDLLVRLNVYQYTGIFIDWIRNGMSDDIVNQIKRMCYLQSGMIEEMLKRSASDKSTNT